jgi:hypothetical protein
MCKGDPDYTGRSDEQHAASSPWFIVLSVNIIERQNY